MNPIDWALVGYGDLAEKRVAAALKTTAGSRLVGVWGRNPGRAREFAARHEIASAFGTLKEGLESTADAVYICTPADSHFDYAMEALRAGKHVLIEKPLTTNSKESELLASEADQRGLTLGVAYYRRVMPKMRRVETLIKSGMLGTPTFVNIIAHSWYAPVVNDEKRWRVEKKRSGGAGALSDIGVHRLDLLDFWLGEARALFADFQHLVQDYEVEDGCSAMLRLKNGAPVHLYFAWNSKTWIDRYEIVGSEAKVIIEPLDGPQLKVIRGREIEEIVDPPPANPYMLLVEDFMGAIREKRPPACDGWAGLRTDWIVRELIRLGSISAT